MTTKPALIQPFAGVLPPPDKAHLVATRSYLTYSDEEFEDKLSKNPFSYLHVIHPTGVQEPHGSDMRPVRRAFESFIERGWLVRDDAPHYYLMRQRSGWGDVTGIVALVSTDAATDGRVKAHEATLAQRESLFARYLEQVGLNAEPTLLAHAPDPELESACQGWMAQRSDFDFTTTDMVRHTLWKVPADDDKLSPLLARISALYIADGHHRVASSRRLATRHPDHPGAQHFMALLVPGHQLVFRGYHRRLANEGDSWSWGGAMKRMLALPEVRTLEAEATPTDREAELALSGVVEHRLAIDLTASGLTLPEWLQEQVFAPIFGIDSPRTDPRLRCLTEEQHASTPVPADQLAFVLPPLDFQQLEAVADAGRHMPPKSTWIAPKLRSGLALYDFGPAV